MTKASIFFGKKRPENLKENLTAQKDEEYQRMILDWYREKDPETKKQKWQAAEDYWAKRRKELGFGEPEE